MGIRDGSNSFFPDHDRRCICARVSANMGWEILRLVFTIRYDRIPEGNWSRWMWNHPQITRYFPTCPTASGPHWWILAIDYFTNSRVYDLCHFRVICFKTLNIILVFGSQNAQNGAKHFNRHSQWTANELIASYSTRPSSAFFFSQANEEWLIEVQSSSFNAFSRHNEDIWFWSQREKKAL